jgi:hypothetical protein
MKIHHVISRLMLLLLFIASGASAAQLPPDEVARQVYHRDVGCDMQMTGTMELISAGGQKRVREYMTLRLDSADERKVMIRFTAPADIAGTGFLVLEATDTGDTEQHLYLPALKRTRRIVAGQKGRSFVNSDFTYEDMQRQPLKNWVYQLGADEEYLGRPCYVLISEPKPATDSHYSRIISLVDAATFMPLKIDFYDGKKRHSKTYRVEKVAMVDGIATEMEVNMEDLLSTHTTRLFTRQIRYNNGLTDALFTTRALEQ